MNDSVVYFLKPIGMVGPIKIGSTTRVEDRLISLMAWSPFKLEIICTAPGGINNGKNLERNIHNCFADCHSHGEWFHPKPHLLDAIAKIKAGVPVEEAIDLSKIVGNILANAQAITRAKNGTTPGRPHTTEGGRAAA